MAEPDCCSGTLHQGTPTGRVETLHDFPTYISEPPNNAIPKAIILFVPDAFGWELPNSRLLADTYAKRLGVRVYLPEFMDGEFGYNSRAGRVSWAGDSTMGERTEC